MRLLADNYAKAGFYCYVPDLHQGKSVPLSFLTTIEPPLKTRETITKEQKEEAGAEIGRVLMPWLGEHPHEKTKSLIESFIAAVRKDPGTGKLGAIGFCWGGKYSILAAHSDVDAAYACHPSLVAVPDDLEGVTKPLSLAVGEKDSLLDVPTVEKMREALVKTGVPHEVIIYEDQVHGFALRSDWSDEKDKKAMDDAEKQGIAWFEKYLA